MVEREKVHIIGEYSKFNQGVQSIFDRCAGSLGVAIYLNNGDDRAFSVSDMVTEVKNPSVADRVHLRKLSANQSIAVHSLMSGTAINGQSYMMSEHDCFHIVAPDQSSVLQIVYPHASGLMPDLSDKAIMKQADALFGDAGRLRDVFGRQVGQAFGAKEAYAPDTVLMFIDITGFTAMSHILGQRMSYDIVSDMQKHCIEPFLHEHNGVIFRAPEGDGLWIGIAGKGHTPVDVMLNDKAIPLAQKITSSYDAMMKKRGLLGYPLKIAMTASEIEHDIQGTLFNANIIHRGIGFFTANELTKDVSVYQNSGHLQSILALDSETAKLLDYRRYGYEPSLKHLSFKP